jgi:hypothetical protein
VKGWWQQTVQELHLSITMQPMALCMLWTKWSVLSLKLLLSSWHRITSSLYSYPVSYLTSVIFRNRYSQHCPVTKYIVMLNSFLRTSSLTNSFLVCIFNSIHRRWCIMSFYSAVKDWPDSETERTWSHYHLCSNWYCIWEAGSSCALSTTERRGMRWK